MARGVYKDTGRECIACGIIQKAYKPDPKRPNVMAVFSGISRRPFDAKTITKAAGSVRICDHCFTRAAAVPASRERKLLAESLLRALSVTYSSTLKAQ